MTLTRRELLVGVSATLAAPLWMPSDLELRDVALEGKQSKRMTLLVPRHLWPFERVPLVVLLHGLGETTDERLGAYAWVERYGLGTAYDRLRRPPVRATTSRGYLTDARAAEINRELETRPLRGLVLACPYMPDIEIARPGALDEYARWLAEVVVPRARAEAPTIEDATHTIIGGCSLGGHFSLEVFLRRTADFGAWAGVQTAIGEAAAPLWANRIADALAKFGPRDLFIESSDGDKFRAASEALAAALARKGIAAPLRMPPGPHDQEWLREAGSLELLFWLDERRRVERRLPQRART